MQFSLTAAAVRQRWFFHAAAVGLCQLSVLGSANAQVSAATTPSVIINEVMPANFSTARDESGKYRDWVELYNTTTSAIDLAGWGLSNNERNPFRWTFPLGTTIAAKGYLRVWLSKNDRKNSQLNLHTNFNIDNGADQIVLSAPNRTLAGITVDKLTLPLTKSDVSICRSVNGTASSWAFCAPATPGAANGPAVATALVAAPVIALPSGVYGSAVSVNVSGPVGAQLRYTLDGSEPTAASQLVSGPVAIGTSSVLRVAAFEAGKITSFTATSTYVIEGSAKYNGQLLMFITMAPADARSYMAGSNAPATEWKSNIELIAADRTSSFKADSMSSEAGQIGSRAGGKDVFPMDIKFNDVVGGLTKDFKYQVFSKRPNVKSFDKLRLRNSGHDYTHTRLRDHFFQSLGEGTDVVPSAYEPVQVFMNGVYYGLLDLRQKEDETLVASTYGVNKDLVDYMSDNEVKEGDFAKQNFDKVYRFISGNDMSIAANYEQAKTLLDVENFVLDFGLHMFSAMSIDWQWRNMHYFGMPSYDGKWRYRVHDFDITANYPGAANPASRNMNSVGYGGYPSSTMMKSLLRNSEFKALYANAIADQLNSSFSQSESTAALAAMAAKLAPYMQNHITKNADPSSFAIWQQRVGVINGFLNERGPFYESHTRQYLGLTARVPMRVSVNDSTMGTVKVNTLDLSTRLTAAAPVWTGGYFPEAPVTLEAIPKPGFVFVRWAGSSDSTARTIKVSINNPNLSYSAVFAASATIQPPVISPQALNYLPRFNNKLVLEPIAAISPSVVTAETGDFVLFRLQAADPQGYPVTFSARSLPSGIDLHPKTGMISGKFNRGGVFSTVVTATNGSTSSTMPISFNITNKGDRLAVLPETPVTPGTGSGLTASYFANATLTGTPGLTRVELPTVNVGAGAPPVPGAGTSTWSIRWEGTMAAPATGTYNLQSVILNDDGVRVWVGGQLIVDNWNGAVTTSSADVVLTGGALTPIKVEFRDISGAASLALNWRLPGATTHSQIPLGVFKP